MKFINSAAALLCASVATARKTVYVLPHSHDDVGWLKTVDQLFDGQRKDI